MATIQLGSTKNANKLIAYAEKRAVESDGVDVVPQIAKNQFKATRTMFGKTDGIQAHHVIQSFKPDEITSTLANKIGTALAKEIATGHECVVYTHADKDHIHNHIIINSVNYENGRKYQLHGKEAIDKVRHASDQLCYSHKLSVIKQHSSKVRYTLAEQGIMQRGDVSWKDELREAIDYEKSNSKSYDEFKHNLISKYGIEINDNRKRKSTTYKHPDKARSVRGNKLGLDYERGTIEHGFKGQIEPRPGEQSITRAAADTHERIKQVDAVIHFSSDERRYHEENDSRGRVGEHSKDQPRDTTGINQNQSRDKRGNIIDIGKAREYADELRRESASSYKGWREQSTGDMDGNQGNASRGDEDERKSLERLRDEQHEALQQNEPRRRGRDPEHEL